MNNILTYDPRTKVFLCIVTCLFSTQVSDLMLNLCFVLFLSIVLILVGEYKKTAIMISTVLATMLVGQLILLFNSNTILMFLSLFLVAIRMYTPIIMTLLLVFQTTKISEFMSAFEKVKAPSSVVIPFAVFFRFIPTVEEEWQGIKKAMAFRGINVGIRSLIFKPIKTIEYIIVPLLASSVSILDEMVASSLVRGLDSENARTCYLDIKFKLQDYIILITGILFVISLYIEL